MSIFQDLLAQESLQTLPESPPFLWKIFAAFAKVPRGSGNESKILEELKQLAQENSLEWIQDEFGNLAIDLPGKGLGSKSKNSVIIQNHVDMVCDKRSQIEFDFSSNSIELLREGEIVKANGTTLGADNGIGCAAALSLIFENNINHPPIRLLFTVEEETGLHGASHCDPKLLQGNYLLNLDGEDFGQLFIGCAGGTDFQFQKKYIKHKNLKNVLAFEMTLDGLHGGHSGVDIHLDRMNAIKLLPLLLHKLAVQLHEINAGKAHNIIPRGFSVKFFAHEKAKAEIVNTLRTRIDQIEEIAGDDDKKMSFELVEYDTQSTLALSTEDSQEILRFLSIHPHGALSFDHQFKPSLTRTSFNLAKCLLKNGEFYILSSCRFNDNKLRHQLETIGHSLSNQFKTSFNVSPGYPAWSPDQGSEIVEVSTKVFEEEFSFEPKVLCMHAGLECGVLLDHNPSLQAISFGPDIRNAHSPDEFVSIPSVEKFYQYFKKLLEKLAQ